jgi:hypothetical protein
MRKFILTIVPFILAVITIILIKPSDDECKYVAIEKLKASNLSASTENIIIKDYVVMKILRFAASTDTVKMGSAVFSRLILMMRT